MNDKAQILLSLAESYPTVAALSRAVGEDRYGRWDDLAALKTGIILELETLVVYSVLTRAGPDVDWKLLRMKGLRKVRRHLDVNILQAYEDGGTLLDDACRKAGLLGPGSDELRHDADKFY